MIVLPIGRQYMQKYLHIKRKIICTPHKMCIRDRHKTRADNTADNRAKISDQSGRYIVAALRVFNADHKGSDNHTHSESGADISKRRQLVLFEISAEIVVFRQSKYCRII